MVVVGDEDDAASAEALGRDVFFWRHGVTAGRTIALVIRECAVAGAPVPTSIVPICTTGGSLLMNLLFYSLHCSFVFVIAALTSLTTLPAESSVAVLGMSMLISGTSKHRVRVNASSNPKIRDQENHIYSREINGHNDNILLGEQTTTTTASKNERQQDNGTETATSRHRRSRSRARVAR